MNPSSWRSFRGNRILFPRTAILAVVAAMLPSLLTSCGGMAAGREVFGAEEIRSGNPARLSNFARLSGEVWRSEQPSAEAFGELEKMGLKSVLNLREYHSDDSAAAGTGLRLYHVPLAAGSLTEKQLEECLSILRSAPKPVLIHCMHGSDRTGAVCAAWRIVFEGWTKERALREMTEGGYGFHSAYYSNLPRLIRETDFDSMRSRLRVPVAGAEIRSSGK